jgi:D-arabinose 1-dehydrogenase-like Zn-dependent alcohol dehydrogenase
MDFGKQAKVEERPLKPREVPAFYLKAKALRIKIFACRVCRTDIHLTEGKLSPEKPPLILRTKQ